MENPVVSQTMEQIAMLKAAGDRSAVYILVVTIIAAGVSSALLGYSGFIQREINLIREQVVHVPIRSGKVVLDTDDATSTDTINEY